MAEGGEPVTAESFQSGKGDGSSSSPGDNDDKECSGKNVDHIGSGSSDRSGVDPPSSHPEPSVSERNSKGKAAAEGASAGPDGMYRGFCPMPTMENWPFNPSLMGSGFDFSALGPPPLVPVLLPAPFPGYFAFPGHDQHLPPGGVFAVPVLPMFGSVGSIPQGGFVPLSFNMPPVPPMPTDGQTQAATSLAGRPEAGRAGPQPDVRDGAAPDGLHQRHVGVVVRQGLGGPRPGDPQRPQQVVGRLQVGFQLDLLLILKLAVLVIVFNQDGTKDRLMLLLLLAGLVYFYQTGALAPILRWISQSAQRAMMPPQQVVPGADGAANAEGAGAAPPNFRDPPVGPEGRENTPPGVPVPDGAPAAGGGANAEGQRADQPPENPNWWGIIKELQMIVVGFLTSLLPGFQHVD